MLGSRTYCLLFSIVCMDFVLGPTVAHTCADRVSEQARGRQLDWVEINKANRSTAAVCSACKFLSWLQIEDCLSLPAVCLAGKGACPC